MENLNLSLVNSAEAAAASWCSFAPVDDASRAALFRAMTAPEYKIGDCINQEIAVRDVFVENVEMTGTETGELYNVPRVVLIDADGHSYQATSKGIFNALRRLCQIYGAPTWETPVRVRVKQVQRGERRYYTLDLA